MGEERESKPLQAPIFVLADDDREAANRIMQLLGTEWYVIPVSEPHQVVRYAKQFAPRAILLADPISYPKGGAARLLQKLLDEVSSPIVILTEDTDPESVARWKRMGAAHCVPHPTRAGKRFEALRALVQGYALQSSAGEASGGAGKDKRG